MREKIDPPARRPIRRIALALFSLAFIVSVFQLPAAPGQVAAPPAQSALRPASPPAPSDAEPAAPPVPTLYMVGYAHLDTQWRWLYPEVIGKMILATMRENLALFEKYPDIVFNFSGARRYMFMKEYWPADFARVKAAVAAGRWFPCGSSIDENDVNVPTAESIIRHVLYGNHWFRRELGTASEEYMLPDCFGFPASLPSILAHCGIKGFSTQKLSWRSAVGIPFAIGVWEGLSGESVVAALDAKDYTKRIKEDLSKSQEWLKFTRDYGEKYGVPFAFQYYGSWGDEGGGLTEESAKNVEQAVSARGGPLRVIAPHADQLFKDITPAQAARLPRFKGDMLLKEHSAGGLTSAAFMKRCNRVNELLADAAERASTFAAWLGGVPYPQKRLNDAWTLTLGSQMHDMLPGTCLPRSYEYAWNDELLASNQFAGVLESAVGSVATALDTRGKGVSLVVYNPLGIEREDVVEARVNFPDRAPPAVEVIGPDGDAVPSQVLDGEGGSLRLLFLARLPSVGFAVYDVRPADGPAAAASSLKVSERGLENDRYRVEIDPDGDVASIADKSEKRQLLASPARLALQGESPRDWPAWNMDWADQQLPPKGFVGGPARIRVIESGPVRVAVEITRDAEDSHFVQVVRLAAGDAGNRVEFANDIHWQSQGYALKATFPMAVSNPKATYNWDVGTIERGNNDPNKFEVPSHQWFDLTDTSGSYGVTVLSDCKYGSDKPDDRTLRLTMIYTPGTHGRGDYQDQGWQDWGVHQIKYGLAGHAGDWRKGRTDWQAWRLNQPPIAFQADAHGGDLGKVASLLKVSSPRVRVLAVKKAEDSTETVVRIVELDGRTQEGVRISFAGPVVAAREVNGQEGPLGAARLDGGELVTDIGPYHARAFAVKLGEARAKAAATASTPIALPFDRCVTSTDGHALAAGSGAEAGALPAEMLPAEIGYRGIAFKLGPVGDDRPNAATCRGQVLDLPGGDFNRVYLLAAATGGDREVTFQVDGRPVERTIGGWGGFIGQWDTRLWNGEPAVHTYAFPWTLRGLRPAYLRTDPVAWFCSHHHDAEGKNAIYEYRYLFACALDLPPGARSLTLPRAEDVLVLAATIARDPTAAARPAGSLRDELRRDGDGGRGPKITPDGGTFADATAIAIHRAFFGTDADIRYTLDGSDPTAESTAYRGPFTLYRETTVKARAFDGRRGGTIAEARLAVDDRTPPSLRGALCVAGTRDVVLSFSEALDRASAEDIGNFKVSGGPAVTSSKLVGENRVVLGLAEPLPGTPVEIAMAGLRDRAPEPNVIKGPLTARLKPVRPVETIDAFESTATARLERPIADEKVTEPGSPWTINFWLKVPRQLDDLTIIAGFGSCDDRTRGGQRFLIKFPQGIHFWGSNVDVTTGVPIEVGRWQMLTAAFDGRALRIYKDGRQLIEKPIELSRARPVIKIGEKAPWPDRGSKLAGRIAKFTLWNEALDAPVVEVLHEEGPGE